jgi:hypothetical protein
MNIFRCRKCGYEKKLFRDIKNHINIQKSCIKDLSCIELTNDQLLIMTLIPFNNNNQKLNYDDIKNHKYTYLNKNLLFNELSKNEQNKYKECRYCKKSFNKVIDLRNHIIIECFEKEMHKEFEKNNIKSCSQNIKNVENMNNLNNCNITNNNITNNITINIEKPIPFNDSWNISNISDVDKAQLMISQLIYTNLLKEILKNDLNLNVIIDKNKDFGIVYQDDIQKYIKMEINEIIKSSMEKLNKNLLDINSELKNNIYFDKYMLDYKTKEINNKYQCYINNEDTQKKVNDCIVNIFDNIKDDSLKIMRNINNDADDNGY